MRACLQSVLLYFALVAGCLAQLGVEQPFLGPVAAENPWPPTANLGIWLKPDTLSGADGDKIATWVDSGPAGHSAVGTTPLAGGYLTNNILDGYPALYFNAGSSGFEFRTNDGGTALLKNVSGVTWIGLVRCPVAYAGYKYMFFWSQGDQNTIPRFAFASSTFQGAPDIWGSTADADTYQGVSGNVILNNTWYLISIVGDFTANTVKYYTNGVLNVSGGSWCVHAGNTANSDSLLAQLGGAGSAGWQGQLVEHLLYQGALDYATLRGIETNYFKPKYPTVPIH